MYIPDTLILELLNSYGELFSYVADSLIKGLGKSVISNWYPKSALMFYESHNTLPEMRPYK